MVIQNKGYGDSIIYNLNFRHSETIYSSLYVVLTPYITCQVAIIFFLHMWKVFIYFIYIHKNKKKMKDPQ